MDDWHSATILNQILGGWSRPITAFLRRERSLVTSTRGAHAAQVGGLVPEASRGGPPFGKLSGGNWIGRLRTAGTAGEPSRGWGRFGAPLPIR